MRSDCGRHAVSVYLKLLLAGVFLNGLFQIDACAAEHYPQRPIRLLIGYPPGGAVDATGRMLAQKLGDAMGQQVIVDNRAGGGSVIASELVARAAPDGYTLLFANGQHAINPGLLKKLPYDTLKDFSAVSIVTTSQFVIVVHPSLAVKNIRELIALAKAKPATIAYGSGGVGSPTHLSVELLENMAGIELVHVPYKGAGPVLTDLIGGQIQLACITTLPAQPHIRSGRLRALATTGSSRLAAEPDIPTVAESGVPGYESTTWSVLLAPAATPSAIVARLQDETSRAIKSPKTAALLATQGAEPVGGSSADATRFVQAEVARWTTLIQRINVQSN